MDESNESDFGEDESKEPPKKKFKWTGSRDKTTFNSEWLLKSDPNGVVIKNWALQVGIYEF